MLMKTFAKYMFLAASMLLYAACINEKETAFPSDNLQKIAFVAEYNPTTKTILAENNDVYWLPDDKIAVSGASGFFVSSAQEKEQRTVFSGLAMSADEYYAVYPFELFDSWNGSVAIVELPSNQTAVEGTFADNFNISVAQALSTDMRLEFKNILGYIKFTVPESESVKSVTVSSVAGETLSGMISVDCSEDMPLAVSYKNPESSVCLSSDTAMAAGDYYIALIPGEYQSGLTVSIDYVDGDDVVKTIDGNLLLGCGQIKNIGSLPKAVSWKTKAFHHRSVAVRFTADWCGYCPNMATAFDTAKEDLAGNLEVISMHCDGNLAFSPCLDLMNMYGIVGFPTGVVDGRYLIDNYSQDIIVSETLNAVGLTESLFDVLCCASWKSTVSDKKFTADVSVYFKQAGDYKITSMIVEDNIVSWQNGAGYDYVHNGVPRIAFTSMCGDALSVKNDFEKKTFTYSADIPDNCNEDNMRLVIYIHAYDKDNSNTADGFYINNSVSGKISQNLALQFAE